MPFMDLHEPQVESMTELQVPDPIMASPTTGVSFEIQTATRLKHLIGICN
jgi:hypothetical protein